jgi:hypothetical protein
MPLSVVLLLASLAITLGAPTAGANRGEQRQVDALVAAIEAEAASIDKAADSARTAGQHWLVKKARYWNLSGLVDGDQLRYLSVRFAQGRVVRDETYYYKAGVIRLAKVRKSWDVEDVRLAPSPPVSQVFFLDGDRVIRRVANIGASGPKIMKDPPREAANVLIARANTFAKTLVSRQPIAGELEALEAFPDHLSPD